MDATLKPLIFYLIALTIRSSLAAFIPLQLGIGNNLFLFHIATPVEYILLCVVFYASLESRFTKRAILISMAGFVSLSMMFSVFIDKLHENNSHARIVEALLVTIWILLYFRQLFTTSKILNLTREPLFWVNTGLLFYFLGTLFLQGLLNYLNSHDKALAKRIYYLEYFFEYLLFIEINIGVFCRKIFRRSSLKI